MIGYKGLASALAIVLTFIAFLPYVRGILAGRVKPHVFSWVIWGMTTCVVFLAQLEDEGGVGAWPVGISGLITVGIALLAYTRRADISITPLDRLFFVAALSALPFWYLTANPLWAVVILTTIDLCGFAPTARKAWHRPWSESLAFLSLFSLRSILVLAALEHYSVTTALFPAAIGAGCFGMLLMIAYRRATLRHDSGEALP